VNNTKLAKHFKQTL